MSTVVTRIAPSPTGYLHFGLARTALFSYLYAKQRGGTFILRIEDTDVARNKAEYEDDIHEQLRWLGLVPDATFRQSAHVNRHTECLQQLVREGRAYVSKEPAKEDASRIVEVVRFKNPGIRISFTDQIRGDISFDTAELGDFVIARSLTQPLYHMAVVVDDYDEGVTHVIRGEDHISNTQRHILLQQALGFNTPQYAHIPLILMPDRSKMSKRREGSSVRHYRAEGILPEAFINYIALLGWNPGTDEEFFTLSELVERFDITQVHKSGAVFDREKLLWYNRAYLLQQSAEEFAKEALPRLKRLLEGRGVAWNEDRARRALPILRERISLLSEIDALAAEGEYDHLFEAPTLVREKIFQKGDSPETADRHLEHIHEVFSAHDEETFSTAERLKETVWEYATMEGRGSVLWPLRYTLSGRERSPDPFLIASVIGKGEVLKRIESARAALAV